MLLCTRVHTQSRDTPEGGEGGEEGAQAEEEERERGLLYEERLERAEQRRLAGNALFSEGNYRAALAKYAGVSGATGMT